MSISKNIHLIFLRRDEIIPPVFKQCEHCIRELHPSWNITLWNEETGIQFLDENMPEYMKAFMSFSHNVQRADFLRLALVYALGGFYMDILKAASVIQMVLLV